MRCALCLDDGADCFDGESGRYICDGCYAATNSPLSLAGRFGSHGNAGLEFNQQLAWMRRTLNRRIDAACENISMAAH